MGMGISQKLGNGGGREWELNRWEWEGMGMLKAIPAHLYSILNIDIAHKAGFSVSVYAHVLCLPGVHEYCSLFMYVSINVQKKDVSVIRLLNSYYDIEYGLKEALNPRLRANFNGMSTQEIEDYNLRNGHCSVLVKVRCFDSLVT